METIGLDNGFRVRGLRKSDIPSFIHLPWEDGITEDAKDIEVAYWRKCWNVRRMILGVLHAPSDQYDFKIDPEDLNVIIRKMSRFFDREVWEDDEDGGSIWTFDEAFEGTLLSNLFNLKWLLEYWKEHPEIEVYFYDSY